MRALLGFLPVAAVTACLAFAGSASAGTNPFSGTVGNGSCDAARSVPVSNASRIEVSVSSTAQDNTNVLAEILTPDGRVVAGGSSAKYDTPRGGTYSVRVCSTYEEQNPPQIQYSGLIGTGPAGQPVLTGPPQPQPPAGGVLGAQATIGPTISGKAAIRTPVGLAWFTVSTASNSKITLRYLNPMRNSSRLVRGLTATSSGNTVRITGHGLVLVLREGAIQRVSFRSSSFSASGKVVRGRFLIVA